MRLKQIAALALAAALAPVPAARAETPENSFVFALDTPYVDEKGTVKDIGISPFLSMNTTYAPLRYTMEAVGAEVDYDEENYAAIIDYNGTHYVYELKYRAAVLDGVSYIPLRNLCEMLGMTVSWKDGLIFITQDEYEITQEDYDYYSELLGYTGFADHGVDYGEPKVNFSRDAGMYVNEFDLTLTTNVDNAEIYYTTDGSEPSQQDNLYTEPIHIKNRTDDESRLAGYDTVPPEDIMMYPTSSIFKGTVVKARAYDADGNATPVTTATYLIGRNVKTRYGVKVVSLSFNEGDFFDPDYGIYVWPNYAQKGEDWERQAFMEVFDQNGENQIAQSVGVRINGGFTRRYQQKSLRIYARENAEMIGGDSKKFKYDFFDETNTDSNGKVIDTYKRLILRNSGDMWWDYYMIDPACASVGKSMGLNALAYSPCVVFFNGEYWGVHGIRERFDEHYVKSHFDLNDSTDAVTAEISDDASFVSISSGDSAYADDLQDLMYFAAENDMSVSENYDKVASELDLDNLIDYYCFNIFFENNDWPMNNVKMWRNVNPDNDVDMKWHWVLSDMDGCMQSPENTEAANYGEEVREYWRGSGGTMEFMLDYSPGIMGDMMRSLLKNKEFAARFYDRYIECIDTYFTTENVTAAINDIYSSVIPLRAEHRRRYPYSWAKSDITPLFEFAQTRPDEAKAEAEYYFTRLESANTSDTSEDEITE